MTDQTVAQRLEALLKTERDALLSGDLARIGTLLEEKQALVDALRQSELRQETLAPLRDGMRRNQQLFDHALAGIRNVAARLGDLNRARKSVDTYDALGQKHTIHAPEARKLERKA